MMPPLFDPKNMPAVPPEPEPPADFLPPVPPEVAKPAPKPAATPPPAAPTPPVLPPALNPPATTAEPFINIESPVQLHFVLTNQANGHWVSVNVRQVTPEAAVDNFLRLVVEMNRQGYMVPMPITRPAETAPQSMAFPGNVPNIPASGFSPSASFTGQGPAGYSAPVAPNPPAMPAPAPQPAAPQKPTGDPNHFTNKVKSIIVKIDDRNGKLVLSVMPEGLKYPFTDHRKPSDWVALFDPAFHFTEDMFKTAWPTPMVPAPGDKILVDSVKDGKYNNMVRIYRE